MILGNKTLIKLERLANSLLRNSLIPWGGPLPAKNVIK